MAQETSGFRGRQELNLQSVYTTPEGQRTYIHATDTSFTAGDSPSIIQVSSSLGRNGRQGSVECTGTSSIIINMAYDGSTYGDNIVLAPGDVLNIEGNNVSDIKLTHTGADSAYSAGTPHTISKGSVYIKDATGGITSPATQTTLASTVAILASTVAVLASTISVGNEYVLVPKIHDYIETTYITAGSGIGEIATAEYRTGGASGSLQATLTMTYDASNRLSTVAKT